MPHPITFNLQLQDLNSSDLFSSPSGTSTRTLVSHSTGNLNWPVDNAAYLEYLQASAVILARRPRPPKATYISTASTMHHFNAADNHPEAASRWVSWIPMAGRMRSRHLSGKPVSLISLPSSEMGRGTNHQHTALFPHSA
ncbi:hypothetical protein CCUS01_17298 [Colletotrichum cuscutae]|uniref:Uncharacterized protein n=1 Tax=Colletotrichum cuscutae TaxID=1209917 RepID=A0AAI9V8E4_9PEZI|nr:hypothetical protein CCUS01_17298 [Colletotrichum cuscutae]